MTQLRNVTGVEYAADGRPADRNAVRERGLLVIGRRLRKERDADTRAGRKHRELSVIERRALLAVNDAEIRSGR